MADEAELRALRRSQDELTVVCDTIRDLTSTLSVRDVLQRLLDRTLRHLEAELASILLVGAPSEPPPGGLVNLSHDAL